MSAAARQPAPSPRPRVFVTQQLPEPAHSALAAVAACEVWQRRGTPSPAQLAAATAGVDGLLCSLGDRVDGELLDACPQLRVVSTVSVGVDHIDLDAATARGIPIGHTPGVLAETTADLAFGLLLCAARRITEGDRFVRGGRWGGERAWEPDLLLGRDLHGATLGVVGLGAIGRAVARRAQGFAMRVLGWNRSRCEVPGVMLAELDELLAAADFVSIHVALAPETRGLIDARALARMRRGAILVNTARGGLVDEAALAAALTRGHLAAAALDVYATEPIDPESPLLALPQLVLTPHIGSASAATRCRMAELAVRNLRAGLAGERLPHCANPAVATPRGDPPDAG